MDTLIYIDYREIYIPFLENYKGGVVPKKGEELKVTPREKKNLLKQKNGKNPCWKEKTRSFQKPRVEES